MLEALKSIATHQTASRHIPAEFGIDGYFFRYKRHFVYWRRLSNRDIGIVTTLQEKMLQIEHLRESLGL